MGWSNQGRLSGGGAGVGYKVNKMWKDRGGKTLEEPDLDVSGGGGRRDLA